MADGRWSVAFTVTLPPTTFHATSGPYDSLEEASAAVIERLRAAGFRVPDAHGIRIGPPDRTEGDKLD